MSEDPKVQFPATPASEPPSAAAAGVAGAPPSNTAPANCIRMAQVIRAGIDSLYVSYRGQLNETWQQRLPELKALAQSPQLNERLQGQASVGEHLFDVHDRGSGRFAFVLSDNWFRVALAAATTSSLPLAYVQISSEVLALEGVDEALRQLQAVAKTIGVVRSGPHVSRADLCVDFTTPIALDSWPPDAWISRAQDRKSHTIGRKFSGWSIGLGGDVSARLYNKTLELQRSRKFYFERLWHEAGWSGSGEVWRLEFQLRRAALMELGIDTVPELMSQLEALWSYCTGKWLRLAVPNRTDDTPSRWLTHPLWSALQSAWTGSASTSRPLARVRKERIPADESLFRQGLGGLTSFMASRGITELDEGFGEFLAQAKSFHETARSKTTFKHYISGKVLEKGKRFSTLRTRQQTEADERAAQRQADLYRKSKDGE